MGSAPLDEISHHVPVRASIAPNVDDGRRRLALKVVGVLHRIWSWAAIGVRIFTIVQLASLLYSATFPLRVGGRVHPRVEHMAYWRRFLAVAVLRVVSSPEPLLRVGHTFAPIHRQQCRRSCPRQERSVKWCQRTISVKLRLTSHACLIIEGCMSASVVFRR